MKRSVFIFLSAVFLSLLVAPIVNILTAPSRVDIKWKEKSFLFNMDFVSTWAGLVLYPFGISTDPRQVIVGREGWLFLGDQHENTLTVDRRPPSKADVDLGQEIGSASKAWGAYLSRRGVRMFRVMIGPNKGTIYSEYLPFWAKPSIPNATDALLSGTGAPHYVDVRPALLSAKVNHSASLYYKTDTHWNSLGAGIAFQAFAQQVSSSAPEIEWPPQTAYELDRVNPRRGGDLANFLRLTAHLSDQEPIIHASGLSIGTTQIDFDTKELLYQTGSPFKPVLVKSIGSLNNKKVLWFRDSFGGAMLHLMTVTFSEVLHLHWYEAVKPGGRFCQLVEEWKPDYVFFTVVERSSKNPLFAIHPPCAK